MIVDGIISRKHLLTVSRSARAEETIRIFSVEHRIKIRDLLESLSQPPYAISWQPKPGMHSLRVQASDRAGNSSEAAVKFTIK